MMLVLNAAGPVNGTLAKTPTWTQRFAAIPGLIGAWDSMDLSSGSAINTWNARHGTGVLRQNTAGNQPTVTLYNGEPVVQFGLGKRLDLQYTFTTGSSVTLAFQLYLMEPTVDTQIIFGGSAAWRARYRSGTGNVEMNVSVGTTAQRAMPSGRWTSLILNQGPSTYTLEIDGVSASGNSAGILVTSLAISGGSSTDTTNNWRGQMRRIVMANGSLTGDQLATVKEFVNQ